MGYGGIFGQKTIVDAFTKEQTFSSATQALYPSGTDIPDEALALLSKAALYKTVAPTAQLGSLAEGSIIYLNENGSPVEFYVAKQGYEPDYNTNRVLVVRKDTVQTGAWNSTNINAYDGSTIDTWFNQTYFQTLDSDVQTAIGTTNIPYTQNGNNIYGVQRISKSVFALSIFEYGFSPGFSNAEGSQVPISGILKQLATTNFIWTRSPVIGGTNSGAFILMSTQGNSTNVTNSSYNYQPAFTLPTTFMASLEPTTGLYDLSDNLLLSLPGVNIETGSYTGTGTYGSGNPNRLTFNKKPIFVFIVYSVDNDITGSEYSGVWFNGNSKLQYVTTTARPQAPDRPVSVVGNVFSWYSSTDTDTQLNNRVKYNYFVLTV